jgi:predicted SAM-dependent methyltransferase
MNSCQYVQYGCGWSAPSGWRNFDGSPTLRFERLPLIGWLYSKNDSRFPQNVEYGNIVKGLPVSPESCNGVYCSHVLEHLALEEFRAALNNTHKVLRPGGIFRLVLPDLAYLAKQYIDNAAHDAAEVFMRESGLGHERRTRNLKGVIVSRFGNSQHLWMWDYKSIAPELQRTGFVAVRRACIGDSSDPTFQEVEDKERWDNCLGVECRRRE